MEALSKFLPGKTGKHLVSVRKHLNILNIQVGLQPKSNMHIILRSNPDGEILRLKDVANIGSSMYDIYSNLNGKPSGAIVLKQSFGNANQVIEDVKPN
jgi:multidrug efflux pump subunit AcrB